MLRNCSYTILLGCSRKIPLNLLQEESFRMNPFNKGRLRGISWVSPSGFLIHKARRGENRAKVFFLKKNEPPA